MMPAIFGLVGTIVGGFLTGGMTFLVSRQQRIADAKKRRTDKLEELVAAVYEFDHWVDRNKQRYVVGEDIPETISPLAKV